MTIGSDQVFQQFMAKDYSASQQILERTAAQVEKAGPAESATIEKPGVLDQMKNWMGAQSSAWKERLANLKQAAEQVTEHIVRLIVIFSLQTLVVPLALLWLLYALARGALRR